MKRFKEYDYPKKKNYTKDSNKEIIDGPQPHWDTWDYKNYQKKIKEMQNELDVYKKRDNLRKGNNIK
tara:strand:+ start:143 stop:343 length:201 start_codon:yes stop_codon:yes gene_type:complete